MQHIPFSWGFIMFDDLFECLEEKYGEEFNWMDIQENETFFLAELDAELNESHRLYGKAKAALAKCVSKDDMLYLLNDDSYAIVHLSYSRSNTVGFPKHIEFPDLQSALLHIENEFVSEYLQAQ